MPQQWQTDVEVIPAQVTILKNQSNRLTSSDILLEDQIADESSRPITTLDGDVNGILKRHSLKTSPSDQKMQEVTPLYCQKYDIGLADINRPTDLLRAVRELLVDGSVLLMKRQNRHILKNIVTPIAQKQIPIGDNLDTQTCLLKLQRK